MRHQQEFLKALMDKAASSGTLTNPAKLNGFLKAVTAAVTADKDFSLTDMAVQFRSLRGENLTFITSPNNGQRDHRRAERRGLRPGEGARAVQGDGCRQDGRVDGGEQAEADRPGRRLTLADRANGAGRR